MSQSVYHHKQKKAKNLLNQVRTFDVISLKTEQSIQLTQKQEYAQLAIKSITNNYPLSQLKPYSAYYSVQQIQQDMKNNQFPFKKTNFIKSHTMYQNIIFRPKSTKDSKNSTFYQTKRSKKQKTKQSFKKFMKLITVSKDDQQNMVKDYFKQNKNITSGHKHIFQTVNQKIKDQFPHHFQPKDSHNQSKCRSKSCNQGFFKRKKYRVQQKYDLNQPGYNKFQFVKQRKIPENNKHQSNSFCIYSRSKNRIIRTQKSISQQISTQQLIRIPKTINSIQMSVQNRIKFLKQSNAYYKRYMRSSFNQKKKTLIQDMKIKMG